MIKNKLIQYLLFYLAFAAVTVFCMFEFWPSSMRPSSFGYVVFFICFLEALVFLFPSLVKSEKTKGETSYLVVLSGFISIYIVVSLILLALGVFLSPSSSTLVYILTIGFTVLFGFLVFIYWNLTESEDIVDIDDDKNRMAKKKINNEFNNMLIKFQNSQEHIAVDNLNEIKDQFDIIQNKLNNMPTGKSIDEIQSVNESISGNIEKINTFVDQINSEGDSGDIEKSILNESNLLKENLKFRQELLKV